jgi:cell division inhibitor SepF
MSNTGLWQKALVYLGLWEEPEAEQYDDLRPPVTEAVDDSPRTKGNVRPLRIAPSSDSTLGSVVRLDVARTAVVDVSTFEDCEQIGQRYRDGQPVLFDLAAVDRTTARRVLDFVSGMTYARHGSLSKLSNRAFLLTAEGVEVAPEERLRLEARGYRFADGA